MRNIAFAFVVVIVVSLSALPAFAGKPLPDAWRVKMSLSNGQVAYWGASNKGWGFTQNLETPASGDIAIGSAATYESKVEYQMYAPHSETAWVWIPDIYQNYPDPVVLDLQIQWYDSLYLKWFDGCGTDNKVTAQIWSPGGYEPVAWFNLSSIGHARMNTMTDSQVYSQGYRIDLASSVPEPSSFLAFASAFVALVGARLRRRRS